MRLYVVWVNSIGLSSEQIRQVMVNHGWTEHSLTDNTDACDFPQEPGEPYIIWHGWGYLRGGEDEEEAHQRFLGYFRQVNPKCRVETAWVCTEYPNEYGSLEEYES